MAESFGYLLHPKIIGTIKHMDILMEAVRQLSLGDPVHKITGGTEKYSCETTLFFKDEPFEQTFTLESNVSESASMEEATMQCLKYLYDKKGVHKQELIRNVLPLMDLLNKDSAKASSEEDS